MGERQSEASRRRIVDAATQSLKSHASCAFPVLGQPVRDPADIMNAEVERPEEDADLLQALREAGMFGRYERGEPGREPVAEPFIRTEARRIATGK